MLEIAFLFIILFNNIILKILPTNQIFNYWDELVFGIIVVLWGIKSKRRGRIEKKYVVTFLEMLVIVVVGIMGNIIFKYQTSASAIIRDIVGFLKFPLSILALHNLNLSKRIAAKFYQIIPLIKLLLIIIFVLGIISLNIDLGMSQPEYRHGVHPYMFLFVHPTYLTTFEIIILLALNAVKECTLIDEIVVLLTIALGMRTRGFILIAMYIFIKYAGKLFEKVKILGGIIVSALIIAVSYSKLMLYVSYASSPRETLYKGGLELARKCMPIGSGFGSFASHLSAKTMSNVYNVIHIEGMYNNNGTVSPVIGDAGYPYYIGQFGILGLGLITFLTINLVKMTKKNIYKDNIFSINMMWWMIAISLITETILVNDGVEIAVMMTVIEELSKMRCQLDVNSKS